MFFALSVITGVRVCVSRVSRVLFAFSFVFILATVFAFRICDTNLSAVLTFVYTNNTMNTRTNQQTHTKQKHNTEQRQARQTTTKANNNNKPNKQQTKQTDCTGVSSCRSRTPNVKPTASSNNVFAFAFVFVFAFIIVSAKRFCLTRCTLICRSFPSAAWPNNLIGGRISHTKSTQMKTMNKHKPNTNESKHEQRTKHTTNKSQKNKQTKQTNKNIRKTHPF